jgi:hypothetical protein
LGRLHKPTLPSPSLTSPTSPSMLNLFSQSPKSRCTLSSPFSMSYTCKEPDEDDGPTIIDAFLPRPLVFDLSPASSASSDFDSLSSRTSFPRSPFDDFVASRSRVVRVCGVAECPVFPLTSIPPDQLYNLPANADAILSAVFRQKGVRSTFFCAKSNHYLL